MELLIPIIQYFDVTYHDSYTLDFMNAILHLFFLNSGAAMQFGAFLVD